VQITPSVHKVFTSDELTYYSENTVLDTATNGSILVIRLIKCLKTEKDGKLKRKE
jgi:hypothetical protein